MLRIFAPYFNNTRSVSSLIICFFGQLQSDGLTAYRNSTSGICFENVEQKSKHDTQKVQDFVIPSGVNV